MDPTGPHEGSILPDNLRPGLNTVSVEIDTARDNPALVALVAQLPAIVEAFRRTGTQVSDQVDTADLLALLPHLKEMRQHLDAVRAVVELHEASVLVACRKRRVTFRSLAPALGVNSPETVRKRIRKAQRLHPES